MREDVPGRGGDARLTSIALQRVDMIDMSETARVEGGKGLWLSSDGTRLVILGDAVTLLEATGMREIARIESAPNGVVAGERSGRAYIAQTTYRAGPSSARSSSRPGTSPRRARSRDT